MIRKVTKVWTSNSGPIRICDMDDLHLYNSIKMLERWHHDANIRHADRLLRLARPHIHDTVAADQVDDAMEAELEAATESDAVAPHPMMQYLLREAQRRGLDPNGPRPPLPPLPRYIRIAAARRKRIQQAAAAKAKVKS